MDSLFSTSRLPSEVPEISSPSPQYLICFSHLRWDFVFQRPQQLMTRFGRDYHVLYVEEPVDCAVGASPAFDRRRVAPGVEVLVPLLPAGIDPIEREALLRGLLDDLVATIGTPAIRWYYTPMMLPFSRHLDADCTVYDCMDELASFRFAPPELRALEAEMLDRADIVFTGGYSLFEAKKKHHGNVYPFPSSVDRAHFLQARSPLADPVDQQALPRPRFGYFGVIDERFDAGLLADVADARPNWTFVMVGPVVKISMEDLPQRTNIHYLGGKSYAELPAYLGGWDVALMPFAINDSTRYISPTKTPEYLAGGKPVVSTPIVDVKRHYGEMEAVRIARTPDQFVQACEVALELSRSTGSWLAEVDAVLSTQSWDSTQARMAGLITQFADALTIEPLMANAV